MGWGVFCSGARFPAAVRGVDSGLDLAVHVHSADTEGERTGAERAISALWIFFARRRPVPTAEHLRTPRPVVVVTHRHLRVRGEGWVVRVRRMYRRRQGARGGEGHADGKAALCVEYILHTLWWCSICMREHRLAACTCSDVALG